MIHDLGSKETKTKSKLKKTLFTVEGEQIQSYKIISYQLKISKRVIFSSKNATDIFFTQSMSYFYKIDDKYKKKQSLKKILRKLLSKKLTQKEMHLEHQIGSILPFLNKNNIICDL